MAPGNPPETWFPVTPPPNGHFDDAPSKEINIDATQHQGKEDIDKEKVEEVEKVGLKKERKKRGHRGRIYLDATFERTPKRRTPNPKTPKPKTPKPAKQKRVLSEKKNTKRKLDKSIIVISEEALAPTNLSVITIEDLSVVTVVTDDKPCIAETSYRRSNLNEYTSSKRSNLNKPAKRLLDLNLDCQLEDENCSDLVPQLCAPESSSGGNLNEPSSSKRINLNKPAKRLLDLNLDCQLEDENSSGLVPQVCAPESSSSGNSWVNMCRGGLLQLRCRCCSCSIGKVKPQFPKENKKLRTALRIKKARKRRLLPTEMRREAIGKFFNCTMLLTHTFIPSVKRRKERKNRFLAEKIQAQQASFLLQQNNIPGLDHSVGGENIKVIDQQASLVNTVKEKVKVMKENVGKVKKEKVTKVKKVKVNKVKTDENGVPVTKEKKKKKKKLAWDERSSVEDMVDYITTGFQASLVLPSLYQVHMETQLEVIVDEESKQVCKLLKDREEDGYDPTEEADDAKQRWWNEQRNMLCEKAIVFMMVMRQFLGNRAFSPWKGSVVDSVVGVYLTQNVSDNLSSSAFMSMMACYPAKPPREDVQLCIEYRTSSGNQQDETESEIPTSQESIASSSLPVLHTDSPESSPAKQKIEEGKGKGGDVNINWDDLRKAYSRQSHGKWRSPDRADSVDWDAVRKADVSEVAKVIEKRGQHNILAKKIKSFLDRVVEDHGSTDLEWLREVPPLKAKEYLLSIHGIGLKSVECLRLLTLHHHAFPVDVNVGRIAVRLGWVPLQPLPNDVEFHLLPYYPSMDHIQEYLWPRLNHLTQATLYELHYLLITFGKVFCTKINPHCEACPLREDCKYYASKRGSSIPSLSWLKHEEAKKDLKKLRNPFKDPKPSSLIIAPMIKRYPKLRFLDQNCEPIIEEPSSPEPQVLPAQERDIEDLFMVDDDDPDGVTYIDLSSQRFANYSEQVHDTSGAIVTLSPGASNANQKLKLIARMRTEHQVYEVPDSHPLLQGLPRRDKDDKCPYLLAIWPQGPDESCQENHQTVPGTLLIPVRSAMRGSFPLNGTYFQVNEVFVDDETSKRPIDVPRNLIWNLAKKTVYCGTSTTSILKGLPMELIQRCFAEGYICTRALNRVTGQPKLLPSMFHQRPTSTPKKKPEEDKA